MSSNTLQPKGTVDALTVDQSRMLSSLILTINENSTKAEQSARIAVACALAAGEALNSAKAIVPHGEWKEWVSKNCVLALRTAQAYMRFSNNYKDKALSVEKAQRVALLPLREAITAIATDPEAPPRVSNERRLISPDTRGKAGKALSNVVAAVKKARRGLGSGCIQDKDLDALRRSLVASLEAIDAIKNGGAL